MSESGMSLVEAKRELEKRQNEVTRCIAELEAAQSGALAEAPRILRVTVEEVYGVISVDRVAVRSENGPTQEKVVEKSIPSMFTIGPSAEVFDLVLMVEHAPASKDIPSISAKEEAVVLSAEEAEAPRDHIVAATGEDQPGEGESTKPTENAIEITPEEAGQPSEAVPTDAAPATEGDEVMVNAEDASPDAVPSGATADIVAPADDASAAEADREAAANSAEVEGENTEESKTEVSPQTVETEGAAPTPEGSGETPNKSDVENATAETNVGQEPTETTAVPAPANDMGCSTVTTEVVVPSTELDFDSFGGQWRYLETEESPKDGNDDEPVEVKAGVRFSTSIEVQEDRAADGRIVELSQKYDAAEMRARNAEALVERLTPATATASSDRRLTGPSSARKSTGKKAGKRTKLDVTRSGPASTPRSHSPVVALSTGYKKLYGTAKPMVLFAWGARNLVLFASAVALIHYHGDYLSV